MITIDGLEWPIPCDIERTSEVTPSEISGMMLDKSYFNDVLGTYMRYDITLGVPTTMADEYAKLYDTLTEPVDGHQFLLPYGNGTLAVTARVESVKDALVYSTTARQYWRGVTFSAVANHPTKTVSLGEVLEIGRSPLPELVNVPVGSVYEKTEDGWEPYSVKDADTESY